MLSYDSFPFSDVDLLDRMFIQLKRRSQIQSQNVTDQTTKPSRLSAVERERFRIDLIEKRCTVS